MKTVEISITHEIKIGREKAWIKAGVVSDVGKHETYDEAFERVTDLVARKTLSAIDQTVESVQNYEKERKRAVR